MQLSQYEEIPPFHSGINGFFGDVRYFISRIKDGEEYKPINQIDPLRLSELLTQPSSNSEIVVKRLLTKTLLEFSDIKNGFQDFMLKLQLIGQVNAMNIDKAENSDTANYLIDLNHVNVVRTDPLSPWHTIVDNDKVVVYVHVQGNRYSIFSQHNIEMTGDVDIENLEIHSAKNIVISANLNALENISLYGNDIAIKEGDITCQHISLRTEKECLVQSHITAKTSDIKAGTLNHHGVIEVSNNLYCIVQYANNNGTIIAKNNMDIVAFSWADSPEAKIHSPGVVNMTAFNYHQNGLLSTNVFQFASRLSEFKGTLYLSKKAIIKSKYALVVDNNVNLNINGTVYTSDDWKNVFNGKMKEMPSLKVQWKKIFRAGLKAKTINALSEIMKSGAREKHEAITFSTVSGVFDCSDEIFATFSHRMPQLQTERRNSFFECIAETVINNGVINAKPTIGISTLSWEDHNNTHLHCLGVIKLVSNNYHQNRTLSTTDLMVKSKNYVFFEGDVHIDNTRGVESNDFRAKKKAAHFTLKSLKYCFFENGKRFYIRTDIVNQPKVELKRI